MSVASSLFFMSLFPKILQSFWGKLYFQDQDDGFVSICETEEVHGPKPGNSEFTCKIPIKKLLIYLFSIQVPCLTDLPLLRKDLDLAWGTPQRQEEMPEEELQCS